MKVMHAVKLVFSNYGILVWNLKSWFGIRNLRLESEIFHEKPWDFESYTRFQLVSGPSLVAQRAWRILRRCSAAALSDSDFFPEDEEEETYH